MKQIYSDLIRLAIADVILIFEFFYIAELTPFSYKFAACVVIGTICFALGFSHLITRINKKYQKYKKHRRLKNPVFEIEILPH